MPPKKVFAGAKRGPGRPRKRLRPEDDSSDDLPPSPTVAPPTTRRRTSIASAALPRRSAYLSSPLNAVTPTPERFIGDVETPQSRPPITPIAKRSAGPPPALRQPCCLRCSKIICSAPKNVCGVQKNKRCGRCAKLKKNCDAIPTEFISDVNALFDLVVQLGQDNDGIAAAALQTRQEHYTKEVTAACRVAGRRGLRKKPANMVEVGLLVLDELTKMRQTMEGALDIMRGR
ncbi:MAG: hypothetical protein M1830_003627 [Pleopsidium flavum]|nr:MAG: hypothetical protein M1830_003627 [Pleopsidium flavum]